jgi:hypothetical protein
MSFQVELHFFVLYLLKIKKLVGDFEQIADVFLNQGEMFAMFLYLPVAQFL